MLALNVPHSKYMSHLARIAGAIMCVLFVGMSVRAESASPGAERVYDVLFDVRILPTQRSAEVVFHLGEHDGLVKSIHLTIDRDRHIDFRADGSLEPTETGFRWEPPENGGSLRYTFRIDHLRDERSFDARCAADWAVFRADDLVPPVRVRTRKGARSDSRIRFRLPTDWSVATAYPLSKDGSFHVQRPDRAFDRPVGWMVAGELGVLRERVAGMRVAVAGPVGHRVRRLDLLALLRWTMPSVEEILGELPDRLLVVSAGDPMWRGGLSGPGSVFVHADRPLMTEDGTSPLLHEILHTFVPISSGGIGSDWIVEGLAERYSLQALVRSRTVSRKRHRKALLKLEAAGKGVTSLRVDRATGDVTARAVVLLEELDEHLRKSTKGSRSLDDVMRELVADPAPVTTERFRDLLIRVGGVDAKAGIEKIFRRRILADPRR